MKKNKSLETLSKVAMRLEKLQKGLSVTKNLDAVKRKLKRKEEELNQLKHRLYRAEGIIVNIYSGIYAVDIDQLKLLARNYFKHYGNWQLYPEGDELPRKKPETL